MKIILRASWSLILVLAAFASSGQRNSDSKMDWFEHDRLGIFIHWGIYSVNGIPESWAFFNNYISHEDYMKQLEGFTAKNYKPDEWAELIKESGAGYSIITTRHHDGVALWDSKMGGFNTRQHTPAKQDLLEPFVKAMRRQKIKTGFYYSLPDWSHPDYDIFTRVKKRYDIKADPERWGNFQKYFRGQLRELSGRHNPDLYWFDGDWEHDAEEWQAEDVRQMLQKYNKNVIINSRLRGRGDYATPEQGVPVVKPADRYWELCLTMNDSWGYQQHDKNYKTSNQVIRTFIDCVSNGGNLLLDIGPKPDGTLPAEQVNILTQLGRWNKKHAEAVFGTRAGITGSNFHGKSTISEDGKIVYLFLETAPANEIAIRGLQALPNKVRVVGSNEKLDFRMDKESGITWVDVPAKVLDTVVTVVSLHFDKPAVFSQSLLVPVKYTTQFDRAVDKSESSAAGEMITVLVDGISSGSNPLEKGVLPNSSSLSAKKKKVLKQLNLWTTKHAEAIEGVVRALPAGYYSGPSTLSADKQTLYLFVDGKPIHRVRIVGNGTLLSHQILNKQYWSEVPGMLYINIPEDQLDSQMTVIAILLDKPLDLFGDVIKPIESN